MVHNHREQPPRGRGGRIPVRVTTLRRPGLRSGGPPPGSTVEAEPPQPITIRIPPMGGIRDALPTAPTAVAVNIPETAPPRYERVPPESTTIPRGEDNVSAVDAESEQPREDHAEGAEEAPQRVPAIKEEEEPNGLNTEREAMAIASRTNQHVSGRESPDPAPRVDVQRGQVTLDPEITGMIRQIAQEQRQLRTEVVGARRETFEVRVLVKTHEARLNQVFKRIGDVIDDQWVMRAGIDELKGLRATTGDRDQAVEPTRTPIKSEPVSPDLNAGQQASPEPFIVTVSGIESLYASERDDRAGQNQGQERLGEHPSAEDNQRQEVTETPGEAWVRNREERRFGLGTEEALERWRMASEASRQQRALRRQGAQNPRQQGESGTRIVNNDQERRSVTQPHEVGFGRRPNSPTPQGGQQPSERGRQPSGGGSSGSSDESRRGGGRPNHSSGRGSSHTGG